MKKESVCPAFPRTSPFAVNIKLVIPVSCYALRHALCALHGTLLWPLA
jgi:hypothetical protein